MGEAWKRETYVRSQSFSSESAVKYLHVGRRKIQISPPPGEQDQSNALPQGQQRQSNPHPMPCLPPRRHYIDRCITCDRNLLTCDRNLIPCDRNLLAICGPRGVSAFCACVTVCKKNGGQRCGGGKFLPVCCFLSLLVLRLLSICFSTIVGIMNIDLD